MELEQAREFNDRLHHAMSLGKVQWFIRRAALLDHSLKRDFSTDELSFYRNALRYGFLGSVGFELPHRIGGLVTWELSAFDYMEIIVRINALPEDPRVTQRLIEFMADLGLDIPDINFKFIPKGEKFSARIDLSKEYSRVEF